MMNLKNSEARILAHLVKAEAGITAFSLSQGLELSWSTVTKALRRLKIDGIAGRNQKGEYSIIDADKAKAELDKFRKEMGL